MTDTTTPAAVDPQQERGGDDVVREQLRARIAAYVQPTFRHSGDPTPHPDEVALVERLTESVALPYELKLRAVVAELEQLQAQPIAADFFQPGHTYIEAKPFTAPEGLTVFHCVGVGRFPDDTEQAGPLMAFGFATRAHPGRDWNLFVCNDAAWSDGWHEYDTTGCDDHA